MPTTRRRFPLFAAALLAAAALFASGCANMPLNKPSALSPAHHGTAEAP